MFVLAQFDCFVGIGRAIIPLTCGFCIFVNHVFFTADRKLIVCAEHCLCHVVVCAFNATDCDGLLCDDDNGVVIQIPSAACAFGESKRLLGFGVRDALGFSEILFVGTVITGDTTVADHDVAVNKSESVIGIDVGVSFCRIIVFCGVRKNSTVPVLGESLVCSCDCKPNATVFDCDFDCLAFCIDIVADKLLFMSCDCIAFCDEDFPFAGAFNKHFATVLDVVGAVYVRIDFCNRYGCAILAKFVSTASYACAVRALVDVVYTAKTVKFKGVICATALGKDLSLAVSGFFKVNAYLGIDRNTDCCSFV